MNALEAIEAIDSYINNMLADDRYDPHVSTVRHLNELKKICAEVLERPWESIPVEKKSEPTQDPGTLVISCDASSKKNPGGPCSVGVVIQLDGQRLHSFARTTPAITINQAEYDAIYEGLLWTETMLPDFFRNIPKIRVYSDSQLVINQLNKVYSVSQVDLVKRNKSILETANTIQANLQKPIEFIWAPRCSTEGLKLANLLAQKEIGVSLH